MTESSPTTCARYHWQTAYDRKRMTPHQLDWAHQPAPFKHYPERDSVPLPRPDPAGTGSQSLWTVCRRAVAPVHQSLPDMNVLSSILALAGGLTARTRQAGGEFYFRSAPSAGALYPNEIYLFWPCDTEPGAGIYHFDPSRHRLYRLRQNGIAPDTAAEPLLVVSGIFFRSAWKYRDRAYRYVLLDAGHLLENLRLAAAANGYGTNLLLDFNDADLERRLGIDTAREGGLGCLRLRTPETTAGAVTGEIETAPPAELTAASRVSSREVSYPAIVDLHRAGREKNNPSTRPPAEGPPLGLTAETGQFLADLADEQQVTAAFVSDYQQSVIRRRSRRNFIPRAMTAAQLTGLLELLCLTAAGDPADEPPAARAAVTCGCLVERVEGMAPGEYLLNTSRRGLDRIFSGSRLREMTAVCLGQDWLTNAALHFVLLTNPGWLDRHWGARGYRYAMIAAGRLGQAIYLGATALGMGCCGIGAFYDYEAQRLLEINSDSALLYLLAAGPVKSPPAADH